MKVKELIEQLKQFDPDVNVVLQKDSEGNGYEHLGGADNDCIITEEMDVYSTVWDAGDACMEEDEWKEFKRDNPRCVVLYP